MICNYIALFIGDEVDEFLLKSTYSQWMSVTIVLYDVDVLYRIYQQFTTYV